MPNDQLALELFNEISKENGTWEDRVQIALEALSSSAMSEVFDAEEQLKKSTELRSAFGETAAKITPEDFRETMWHERLPDVDEMLGNGAHSKAGMIAFDKIQDRVVERLEEFAEDVKDE